MTKAEKAMVKRGKEIVTKLKEGVDNANKYKSSEAIGESQAPDFSWAGDHMKDLKDEFDYNLNRLQSTLID